MADQADINLPLRVATVDASDLSVNIPIRSIQAFSAGVEATIPLRTAAVTMTSFVVTDITIPLRTIDASGESNSADIDLPVRAIAATGESGGLATLNVDIPLRDILAWSPGIGDVSLPLRDVSVTGFIGSVGDATISIPLRTIAGTGYDNPILTGGATLPLRTVSATLTAPNDGTAAVSVPLRFAAATALSGGIGSASVSIPLRTTAVTLLQQGLLTGAVTVPLRTIQATLESTLPSTYRTWCLNTQTRALTEYDSIQINSACRFGGRELVAGPSGFYELVGGSDAGQPINARVRLGQMDFSDDQSDGTIKKRVPEAFIGYRSTGAMTVSVVVEDGSIYSYSMPPNARTGLHQDRVKFGKGLNQRYYQFEFSNAGGTDFDIDSFMVNPVKTSRRIER